MKICFCCNMRLLYKIYHCSTEGAYNSNGDGKDIFIRKKKFSHLVGAISNSVWADNNSICIAHIVTQSKLKKKAWYYHSFFLSTLLFFI